MISDFCQQLPRPITAGSERQLDTRGTSAPSEAMAEHYTSNPGVF